MQPKLNLSICILHPLQLSNRPRKDFQSKTPIAIIFDLPPTTFLLVLYYLIDNTRILLVSLLEPN